MSDITNNPVFHYRAGEETTTSAWEYLVRGTEHMGELTSGAAIIAWECEYKAETNLPMPGAWRSAKSVLLSAKKIGIKTVNVNGQPIGKSALEAAIKEHKSALTSDKTPEEKLAIMVNTAKQFAEKHGLNLQDYL